MRIEVPVPLVLGLGEEVPVPLVLGLGVEVPVPLVLGLGVEVPVFLGSPQPSRSLAGKISILSRDRYEVT